MSRSKAEIERKFLLKKEPPGFDSARKVLISQGYLVDDSRREIRVRRQGYHYFLTVKDGRGEARMETELPISEEQFKALWELTADCRIEKERSFVPCGDVTLEVDVYSGDLEPLRVAEVEFPDQAASAAFVPPPFLGKEVTGREEYSNLHLATHGRPSGGEDAPQVGALPFLFKGRELHVVLITSSSGNRWIVPKGQIEEDMSRPEVALMEAAEEAGVIGTIEPSVRSQCHVADGRELHLYALRVSTLLKRWPEASFRKRSVLPLNQALASIEDKGLAACIRRLAGRLNA